MNGSRYLRPLLSRIFVAIALTLAVDLQAQNPAVAAAPDNQTHPTMKQFVFLFFPGQRQLSEAEQDRRNQEIRAWARHQNGEGHKLDPRVLAKESFLVAPEAGSGPAAGITDTPTVILFLQAQSFAEAVEIAKTHPGVRYGVSIEVRPWNPPPAPTTP